GLAVRIIRFVYGDIGMVGVAAAGHRDVEVLPCRRCGHDRMRGVGRYPLCSVRGDGVPEVPQTRSPVIVRACTVSAYRKHAEAHTKGRRFSRRSLHNMLSGGLDFSEGCKGS